MTISAHLLRDPDQEILDHLYNKLLSDVNLTVGREIPDPAEYQVLVAGRPERREVAASPHLQAIIIPWAGIPQETRELMEDFPGIRVHNLHHNAVPVAEMAMALALAAAKFIVPIDRAFREHDWTPRYRPNPAVLMESKTALILGYGAIGKRVARACQGLGMEVIATRRHVEGTPANTPAEIHPPEALHDLLPRANVLFICLPLTSETRGLIGKDELSLLPPKAVLVNVGRGPIVDETALYRVLHDGTLYAAGLDVWYNYPDDEASRSQTAASGYPFHELDNVVMSPHRAGAASGSTEIEKRRMTHLTELLNAAARGEEMPNHVDLEAGY